MPRIRGNNTSVVDTNKLASGGFGGTQVDYSLTFCCLLAYTIFGFMRLNACVSANVYEEAKIKLMKFWS